MVYIIATHSQSLHDKNNVQVSKLFIVLLCIYIEKKYDKQSFFDFIESSLQSAGDQIYL